jgi:hypothetical protein
LVVFTGLAIPVPGQKKELSPVENAGIVITEILKILVYAKPPKAAC